jgi:hypothetical protein
MLDAQNAAASGNLIHLPETMIVYREKSNPLGKDERQKQVALKVWSKSGNKISSPNESLQTSLSFTDRPGWDPTLSKSPHAPV